MPAARMAGISRCPRCTVPSSPRLSQASRLCWAANATRDSTLPDSARLTTLPAIAPRLISEPIEVALVNRAKDVLADGQGGLGAAELVEVGRRSRPLIGACVAR